MTRDEALNLLVSVDADDRLKGARFFAMKATARDYGELRSALRNETVPWIKRALERSLTKAGPVDAVGAKDIAAPSEPSTRELADLRAAAIHEVASTIIHELATIVASLRLAAPREAVRYPGSRTQTLIDSLAGLLSGIRNLKTAAGRAEYVECDLALECRDACAIFEGDSEKFHFAGHAPFIVEMDPGLFKLALTNVVRNAVEAVTAALPAGQAEITLNWGRTSHENWVAILDNGPGFEREPATLIDFGKSTKNEHIGFGLATAKQAMQAMEGDMYPSNNAEGGARVELRWFRNYENPFR